jgi:tetratricopeptide (TPR) repeat protein
MSFKVSLFFLLFSLLTCRLTKAMEQSHAADSLRMVLFRTDDVKEKCLLYLQLSKIYEDEQPDSALGYLGSAATLAKQLDDPALLGEVYYSIGNIAVIRNQLDLALTDYKAAAILFKRAADTSKYTRMLMLQGNIMGVRDDAGAAMSFYIEAIGLAEKTKYNALLPHLYNNTGAIYQQSDDRKKALFYFTKALTYFTQNHDTANLGNALLNIGSLYIDLGNIEMAKNYVNRALVIFSKVNDYYSVGSSLLTLGMIETEQANFSLAKELLNRSMTQIDLGSQVYEGPQNILRSEILIRTGINFERMGEYQQARDYLLKGYHLALSMKQPRMIILATNNLSKTYEKLNNDREALRYYKLYMQQSDSLSKVITVRTVKLTEIRQEYMKKQKENELRIRFEKSGKRTMLIIYIISGAVFLAVIFILFLLLKLEKNRKKQAETEKMALDEKLEFHNREMTTNVMYINKMNEQVVQIAEKLKNLSIDEDSPNAQVIKSIIKELGQGSQTDSWREFEVRFEKIHSDFYRHLTEKYPDLTPNELKLCAFLRLNMSTKEISALTYQSENSIMVARTRLRQKLDISRTENLVTFLSQF